MSIVYAQSVSHKFDSANGKLAVLDSVSLSLDPGGISTILGPSGCGKTTLLRCLGGLLIPSSGTIIIDNQSPRTLLARKEVGFGFQEPALLPWRTVVENVRLPLEIGPSQGSSSPTEIRVEELLKITGLQDFRDYYPDQLSGGMKQRVALARALLIKPTLLLLDEPLSGLDLLTRTELMVELSAIFAQLDCPIVIVTHSVDEAVFWGSQIIVLSELPGRILKILENATRRPRELSDLDTHLFHQLTGECRRIVFSHQSHEAKH